MTDTEPANRIERLERDRRRLIGAKIKVLANDGSCREATVEDVIFRHGCEFVKLRFADSHFETFETGYIKTDPPLGHPSVPADAEIRSLQGALDRPEQQSSLSESDAGRKFPHAPEPNQQSRTKTRWKGLRRAFLGTAIGNFILCAALVTLLLAWRGEILYGLIFGAIFGSLVAAVRSKDWERAVKFVGGLAFAILIIAGVIQWLGQAWKSHQAERTADVRAVFLHPADRTTGPQVYMNDGTVWALSDAPDDVRMIKGDEVRYVSLQLPQGFKARLGKLNSLPAVPDVCQLRDVTTGYATEAVRLSAPFKHSSCPAK